jgi:hypothetical protein
MTPVGFSTCSVRALAACATVLLAVIVTVGGAGTAAAQTPAAPEVLPPSIDPFYTYEGSLDGHARGAVLATRG